MFSLRVTRFIWLFFLSILILSLSLIILIRIIFLLFLFLNCFSFVFLLFLLISFNLIFILIILCVPSFRFDLCLVEHQKRIKKCLPLLDQLRLRESIFLNNSKIIIKNSFCIGEFNKRWLGKGLLIIRLVWIRKDQEKITDPVVIIIPVHLFEFKSI